MPKERRETFLFLLFLLCGIMASLLFFEMGSCRPDNTTESSDSRPGQFQRIICATPGIAEITFALGGGDRVVGVSTFSTFPPEARTKADIGGLINPNRERILSLRPDLYITQSRHTDMGRFCRDHGIHFLSLEIETFDGIEKAVRRISRFLGRSGKADILLRDIHERMNRIRNMLAGVRPKNVFLTMGHTPGNLSGIITTGPGTFLDELILICGGRNIFHDTSTAYPEVSKESVIVRSPEVIIEVFTGELTEEKRRILRRDWNRLPSLPAVQNGAVYFLTEDYLLVPGMRVTQAAEKIARLIHPEVFHE